MVDFYAEAKDLFEYTQALRRDFHQHPEIGFEEIRTAGIVAKDSTKPAPRNGPFSSPGRKNQSAVSSPGACLAR